MSLLSLRWRYVIRDIRLHFTRSLLVMSSIAVGIFAFSLILATASTLALQLPANYLGIRPAGAILHTSLIDDDVVESIRRIQQVGVAEGRRKIDAQFFTGREWQDIRLFALEEYEESRVDIVRPYQGAWPPPERQLLIERNSLFLTGAEVGDSLLIELSDGLQRTLPIVGLAHDMNQPPAQITGIPYAYVSTDTLEWLGLDRGFNEIHIVVNGDQFDKRHITTVAKEAGTKLEDMGATVPWTEIPEPGEHFVMDFLPTILLILGILGVLALILSGFLVFNVITSIVTQQLRQIGVMKAIGAQTGQIMALYLGMVLVFGAVALLLVIPLGALGARAFAGFIAGQLNFDLSHFRLAPWVVVLEVLVGLAAPILAAVYPVTTGARMTVREAIQGSVIDQDNNVESHRSRRLRSLQQGLGLPRPLQLSLRNTFRRRARLIRTLIPLALGGAIFMSVLHVRASLFYTLEETLISQGFDLQIRLNHAERIGRLEDDLAAIADVHILEGWVIDEAVPVRSDQSDADNVILYALPADTQLYVPNLLAGRWLTPDDRNAIVVPMSLLEEEPEIKLNQDMIMRIDGEEERWHVVGIYRIFQPPLAPMTLYVNRPYYWKQVGGYGRVNMIRIFTNTHDAATHSQTLRDVRATLAAEFIDIRSTRTATADRVIFSERFNIITVILILMAILLATVGSLGLMATMSINVLERTREIGVMRAIGATNQSIFSIFIIEGILIGLLSWLGAFLIALPMSRLMSRQIGIAFTRSPLSYIFDVRAPLLWLLIVILVATLACMAPARNAVRLSVKETLAHD